MAPNNRKIVKVVPITKRRTNVVEGGITMMQQLMEAVVPLVKIIIGPSQ
jgi:hypothetical protein